MICRLLPRRIWNCRFVCVPAGGGQVPAPLIEMEWHMKRLYHRCGVSSSSLSQTASLTLRPEPDFKWVLLWRDNQRHRPPSKL
jgi:hypothetical protein